MDFPQIDEMQAAAQRDAHLKHWRMVNEHAPTQATPDKQAQTSVNDVQYGGSHYKDKAIQPWDYIVANNIPFLEGSAIKYLTRWRDKGGLEDLRKALHFVQKAIEVETARGAK